MFLINIINDNMIKSYNINKMICQILLSAFVILGALFFYRFYVQPKKLKQHYLKHFREKGFKIYEFPNNFLNYPALQIIFRDSKRGDAFGTFKDVYANHDLTIGNSFNAIELTLASPELVKQFIKNQQNMAYVKRKIMVQNLKRVVGDGLTFSQKQMWKKKRKIVSKVFNFQFISKKHNQIVNICEESLDIAQADSKLDENTFQYDIMKYTGELASNVITKCFLGGKSQNQKIGGVKAATFLIQLINDVNIQSSSPVSMLLGPKFLNLGLRKLDKQINQRIKLFNDWGVEYINHKIAESEKIILENPDRAENMIEALLLHNKKNPDQYQFTSFDILQEFKNFMLAGTDTTSHYIQVIVAYLSQNPDSQKKLREEIDDFLITEDYSSQGLKKLKYLEAVEKETTRLYGPVNFNFPRVVDQDHIIAGVPIFKGTLVKFNNLGTHYSQNNYKEPKKFRPQRWLNGECDNLDTYKLLGFGAGPRSCIGKHLALIETKIAIVKMFKRYRSIKMLAEKLELRWKFLYVPDNFNIKVTKK